MTPGTMLLYGGIAGMAAVVLIAPIILLILRSGRKRLKRMLDAEYELPEGERGER